FGLPAPEAQPGPGSRLQGRYRRLGQRSLHRALLPAGTWLDGQDVSVRDAGLPLSIRGQDGHLRRVDWHRDPPVQTLDVHLKDKQCVYFNRNL
ncbi:hypothetical protein E4U14_005157, partial [Claviceps sp. LM454 group G7]